MKILMLACMLSVSCTAFAGTKKVEVSAEPKLKISESVAYYNEADPSKIYTSEYVEGLPNAIFANEQDYRGNRLRTTDSVLPSPVLPQWHFESQNKSVIQNTNPPKMVE